MNRGIARSSPPSRSSSTAPRRTCQSLLFRSWTISKMLRITGLVTQHPLIPNSPRDPLAIVILEQRNGELARRSQQVAELAGGHGVLFTQKGADAIPHL